MDNHSDHGVEHIPDSTFVIPIIDQRSLNQLNKALKTVAEELGVWDDVKSAASRLYFNLSYLRELAVLSRYVLAGDTTAMVQLKREFEKLQSRLSGRTTTTSEGDLKSSEQTCVEQSDLLVNLTAFFDLLLIGKVFYKDDANQYSKLCSVLVREFKSALSTPLFYAQVAKALVQEKGSRTPPEVARSAVVALIDNLINLTTETNLSLPKAVQARINDIANYFQQPALVDAVLDMIDDNTLPIESLNKAKLETGEILEIKLARECKLDKNDLLVLFSPAYYRANILHFKNNEIKVEVPAASLSSRVLVLSIPNGKTLEKLNKLTHHVRKAFPDLWGTSSLGMIPFNRWAYPNFNKDSVPVCVYEPTDNVGVRLFDDKSSELATPVLLAGKQYRGLVTQVESHKNPNPLFKPTFSLGTVEITPDNGIVITPKSSGNGILTIELLRNRIDVEVQVIPDVQGLNDAIGRILERNCDDRPQEEFCHIRGRWDPVVENALAIVAVHAVVLHTGKILFYSFDHRTVNNNSNLKKWFNNPNLGSYQLWDPVTGVIDRVKPTGRNLFCAGQCHLPNGHILVAGGQDGAGAFELTKEYDKWLAAGGAFQIIGAFDPISATIGLIPGTNNGSSKDVHTYDPVNDSWSRWPDMEEHRYYPTCEIMPDGQAIVVAGLSNLQRFIASGANWHQVDYYETFNMNRMNEGATARGRFRSADQYPIIRLLPGSNYLFTHIHNTTYLFDVDRKSWVSGAEFTPPSPVGRWTYPMQTGHVLLPQYQGDMPRVFISGGSVATNFDYNTQSNAQAIQRGYIFELDADNVENSRWRETIGRPHTARLLNDHVLLPDGTVFIVNGISGGASSGHNQAPVLACEIFDPETETFTEAATPDENHPRGYHAVAFLLPDGRVAISGHTRTYNEPPIPDDTSIQVYNPPYMCRGERPQVTGIDASYDYGETVAFPKPRQTARREATIDLSQGLSATAVDAIRYRENGVEVSDNIRATIEANRDGLDSNQTIAKVMLIRPAGVTHTVDMSQRGIWLVRREDENNVYFDLPTDRSLAPPGYYMMFFLNDKNIPSVASWIHVGRDFRGESSEQACPESFVYEAPLNLGTIENRRNVEIVRNGDIYIKKIDQHCNVQLTSRCGSIYIEEKFDQHCWVTLSARHNVLIGEKADQHCIINIDCGGDVTFGWKAGSDGKIDQHCQVNVHTSHGNLRLTKKVDGNSSLNARVDNGNITIEEKVDGHSVCTLYAPNGDIRIDDKVGGDAQVHWSAQSFSCPNTNDGEVFEL